MESKKAKHIVEGFPDDFDLIKDEYSKYSPDLRLEDFFKYWKSAHMDCLFANRFDPRELLESIIEMNKRLVSIVTNDLMNSSSRLIGLYFLLCLSAKQPIRLRQKIRLTCHDAIKVQKLCDEVKLTKAHDDANFSWHHLRSQNSINFAEERLIRGPSMLSNRGSSDTNPEVMSRVDPVAQAQKDTKEFLSDKIEPAIEHLDSLCSQYSQLKDTLKLNEVSDATVELDSTGTLEDYLGQAKDLLRDYKASLTP